MKAYLKNIFTVFCLMLAGAYYIFAQAPSAFEGVKTNWHGFDHYDYFMGLYY